MSNIIALTIPSETESVRRLGFKTICYPYNLENLVDNERDIVIRLGNSSLAFSREFNKDGGPIFKSYEFKNVLNPAKFIRFNCCKSGSARRLGQVVNVPKYYVRKIPRNKTVVLRPIYHQAAGKDFNVIRTKKVTKIPSSHYANEFIRSDRELRVWYINGKTMCARRVTKSKARLNERFKCRSLWGYRFYDKVPKLLHSQVIKAAKHIKMDFGAFDIIYKNRKYYFLENNSCPTFDNPELIKWFKKNFQSLIKKKFKKVIALKKEVKLKKQKLKSIW